MVFFPSNGRNDNEAHTAEFPDQHPQPTQKGKIDQPSSLFALTCQKENLHKMFFMEKLVKLSKGKTRAISKLATCAGTT